MGDLCVFHYFYIFFRVTSQRYFEIHRNVVRKVFIISECKNKLIQRTCAQLSIDIVLIVLKAFTTWVYTAETCERNILLFQFLLETNQDDFFL